MEVKKRKISHKGARQKGLAFERFVANKLKHLFPNAKRHLESQIQDCMGYDIDNTGNLYIQCKAYAKYAPLTKIQEVKAPSQGIPVLATKGNNQKPMVAMYLDDFIKIIEDIGEVYDESSNRSIISNERSAEGN